ncbi:MAG: hypothetical protein H6822_18870 [Planctomycetaceae bacterium]|nr:hypothetical protein [Planctomycetales bacterium]MCB9924251.1 hypothetical protein [Planctomycetaceae bacterium]
MMTTAKMNACIVYLDGSPPDDDESYKKMVQRSLLTDLKGPIMIQLVRNHRMPNFMSPMGHPPTVSEARKLFLSLPFVRDEKDLNANFELMAEAYTDSNQINGMAVYIVPK